MFPTKNSLPEEIRSKVVQLLQGHLANSIDIYLQIKQAHWNVKGPGFIALHELFDEIAESSEEWIDLVAERSVQLGGEAEGTISSISQRTALPEYPITIASGEQHVQALSTALARYGEQVRKAIEETDALDDMDTCDILTEISRSVDKYLWFVESHSEGLLEEIEETEEVKADLSSKVRRLTT